MRLLLPTSAVGNNKQAADVGLLQDHADVVIAMVATAVVVDAVASVATACVIVGLNVIRASVFAVTHNMEVQDVPRMVPRSWIS